MLKKKSYLKNLIILTKQWFSNNYYNIVQLLSENFQKNKFWLTIINTNKEIKYTYYTYVKVSKYCSKVHIISVI